MISCMTHWKMVPQLMFFYQKTFDSVPHRTTQRKQMCNYNTETCVVSLSPVLTHYTCAIHHRCAPLALVL